MHFKAKITIKQNNVTTNEVALEPTQTAKIAATENMQVSLSDIETGKPITKLQAKKSGNDLVIADESGEQILTIENYYSFDNIEVGALTNESFVRFAAVDPASGKAISLVSETSYTPLVTDMLGNASVQSEMAKDSLSNGKVWGGIGALAIGASAISLSNSDDGKDGAIGPQGEAGQDGKSAYEVAVEYGYQGSFEQWVAEMKGEDYVDPTNTLPSANDTSIRTKEDVSFSGKLSPATDSDGDKLQYDLTEQAKNGTAVINKDGSFIYFPDRDYNGEDSFTYSISDGRGGVITKTTNIIIDAVNDAPESENTIITLSSTEIMKALEEGKPIVGQLAEATDVDRDDLVYSLGWYSGYNDFTVNENGSYAISPFMLGYRNSLNLFNGETIFTYVVSDSNGGQIIRNAILDFKNTAPVSNENNVVGVEKDHIFEGDLNSLTNDIDRDQLTFKIDQQPLNGTVELDSSGIFKYAPNTGYIGNDSFTYIADDGFGAMPVLTANIVVSYNNNEPVSKDSFITIKSDEVAKGKLEEATDIDGDVLEYVIEEQPNNGLVVIHADGSYEYQPNTGFNGVDKFTYTINDGYGGVIKQTATVEVGDINHAPVSHVNREGTMSLDWSTGRTWRSPIFESANEDEFVLIGYHENNFKLEKYNEAGELLFTINREDIVESYGYLQVPVAATVTRDGKILILFGHNSNGSDVLVRLNKDGSLDKTFNPEGLGESIIGTVQLNYDFYGEKILVSSQGDIAVVGQGNIAKFNSDGTIDTKFNSDGWLTGQQGVLQVEADKYLSDGQLLDTGNIIISSISNSGKSYLDKYDTSGNLVNSYNITYSGNGLRDTVVLEQDEVLLLFETYSGFKLVKVNEDFSSDDSFHTNQEQMLKDLGFDRITPENMTVDNAGRILVTARGVFEGQQVQALLRLNSDGTLDQTFNSNSPNGIKGLVLKEVSYSYDDLSFGIEVTSKGNIFVATKVDDHELTLSKYLNSGEVSKDIGANIDLQISQNGIYVFQVDDFGFKDLDGDDLKAVFIDGVPEKGELLLNGIAVTEGQKIDVIDIESGNLVFRPEKIIIQDDYATLTYRVQDNGGTANGAIDISQNQATLVIDVLPSAGPSSKLMVALQYHDVNTLLDNMESEAVATYSYNDVSSEYSSQVNYSIALEQSDKGLMLEDILDVSGSLDKQLLLDSKVEKTSMELGLNELQQDDSIILDLAMSQTQELEKAYITEQASYII